MKRWFLPGILMGVAIGYYAGRGTRSSGHTDEFALIPRALAAEQSAPPQQPGQTGAMPFGFNRPNLQPLAPDAPAQALYWSIDDIRKAHSELAGRAAQAQAPGRGSTQAIGGGSLVRVRARTHTMSMLYRAHREQPVASLTGVMSLWDDAEQHAGVYDFYIITGGSGEMIVGGEIAGRKNLMDQAGPVPGEYRGQPIKGGQTYKVKAGDWLLIPPDAPHQPKPDPGGFSYMIMKINVGVYPWNLIR
ncbi:MAG: AraC family ligand binding domain-containing protein [Acidobacteriia bacterium]|nr:AraC family ligand binding domain-containing protein [Terriglobia bacterium]